MGQLSSGPGIRLFVDDDADVGGLPVALAYALRTVSSAITFGASGAFVNILLTSLWSNALYQLVVSTTA